MFRRKNLIILVTYKSEAGRKNILKVELKISMNLVIPVQLWRMILQEKELMIHTEMELNISYYKHFLYL
jgi:hypothetical protein